jgi:RNA 2',3'-cyclic 3'-phosphodiesterase
LLRLFVALDFPEDVREKLRELIARLKPECRKARWVRPEGMHITLKFIGHVDEPKAESIATVLKEIHSSHPVEMRFRGVGFFPNERRPRVVWCGVEASSNLAGLAEKIGHDLKMLGVRADSRPYVPHLTLARLQQSSESADKLVRAATEWKSRDFGNARESEFHLFESVLKPSGAEYKRLQTYPFVKGAA